ncbi:DNA polymerase-3 subunit gamma/tau [Orbus hercynius]|uniref:DNA polymerase III subunit gamma/tau n=1 Tax=Orbus hercynius TaxID=593135 RepID=A0A495RIS1_9GAMM|nr:DNA polymerase-3 subunit gamma/tau [Orbus hercynius]
MSYQVLARKWRPKAFADVVGQQHVLTVLANALSLGRVHHAYLFSGTRGVGKTSIARLLAKGLNCEKGITANPCGECDNCRDIELGRFIDLLEIDAASRTKVEDTREILDNIQYLPTKGRFKVYLIDEVHMLSRSSFNALLKTLEEPPEHVKFLLATTDPQKLPITILSRCLHLHLSVLDHDLIRQQLVKILHSEQIEADDKALQLLAQAANGSMRDALSLTDQSIALGNGKIDTQSVSIMLGTLDKVIPFELIEAMYQGDGNRLMQHLEQAAKQGVDWDHLLTETLTLLHQISLLQIVPSAIGDYSDYQERIRYLAQHIAPNDVQLFYQILLMGRKELTYAPDKKMGVEMGFLRALAFIPKTLISSNAKSDNERQVAQEDNPLARSIDPAMNRAATDNQPIQELPIATTKKTTQLAPPPASAPEIDHHVADATKSILAARQQVIESEKNVKKSDQVERTQPELMARSVESHSARLLTAADPSEQIQSAAMPGEELNSTEETAETYQWQFSEHFTPNAETVLDAKTVKQAFLHEKTPELNQKLIDEAAQIDSWSAEINILTMPPLIKQIAINAFLEYVEPTKLILHIRSTLAHLVRSDNNVKRLAEILSSHRGQELSLTAVVDDDKSHLTPLEVREKIYQTKLAQAKKGVLQDSKVAMICQFFEARIDEESIRPV